MYVEAGLFLISGYNVPVGLIANCFFAGITAVLVFDASRRLFGSVPALIGYVLVAFWPSLVLWSALNLKDALALVLIATFLWALVRFQLDHRWRWLATAIVAIGLIESVRVYVYAGLLMLLPLAPFLAPDLRPRLRVAAVASTCLFVVLVLPASRAAAVIDLSLVNVLESTRSAMTIGARTAFAKIVTRQEGQRPTAPETSGVSAAEASKPAGPAPTPAASPIFDPSAETTSEQWIGQGQTADVAPRGPASSSAAVGQAAGRSFPPLASPSNLSSNAPAAAANVVTMTAVPASPQPTAPPVSVSTGSSSDALGPAVTGAAEPSTQRSATDPGPARLSTVSSQAEPEGAFARTLDHLPTGLAHALLAPFPWSVRRPADLPAVGDTLLWLVLMLAAIVTLIWQAPRWRLLMVPGLFVAGLLIFLALAEGNVGTLFRHRGMIIPTTALLASPTLVMIAARMSWRLPIRAERSQTSGERPAVLSAEMVTDVAG